MIGAPYRLKRSSKCLAAAVKKGSTTLTGENVSRVVLWHRGQSRRLTFDGRLRNHAVLLLDPVDRNTTSILYLSLVTVWAGQKQGRYLDVTGVVWVQPTVVWFLRLKSCGRVIERSSQRLRDNLLRFNFVGYISLAKIRMSRDPVWCRADRCLAHLVIHSSLQVPCASIMSGSTCDEGHIDNATKDRQFYDL